MSDRKHLCHIQIQDNERSSPGHVSVVSPEVQRLGSQGGVSQRHGVREGGAPRLIGPAPRQEGGASGVGGGAVHAPVHPQVVVDRLELVGLEWHAARGVVKLVSVQWVVLWRR